jgi:fucose permease
VGILVTGSVLGTFGGAGLVSIANLLAERLRADPIAIAWLIAPAVFLPALLLVWRIQPDPREIASNLGRFYPGYTPAARAGTAGHGSLRTYVRDFPKLTAFVATFFVQGNMSMMMALTALVLDHHGHGLPDISLAVAIHVVGMFGLAMPLGRLADRLGRRPVLLGGVLVGAVASLVTVASGSYWVIVLGIFLVGLGWSAVTVTATALLADTSPVSERGRVIGSNDTFSGLSSVLMPVLGGLAAEAFGLQAVGAAAFLLSVIPLVFLVLLQEPNPGRFPQSSYRPAS